MSYSPQPILISPLFRRFFVYCPATITTASSWFRQLVEVIYFRALVTFGHLSFTVSSTSTLSVIQSRYWISREHVGTRLKTRALILSSPLTASQKVSLFIVFGPNWTKSARFYFSYGRQFFSTVFTLDLIEALAEDFCKCVTFRRFSGQIWRSSPR